MKYYIPISCLNLDNILQSESISPLPFYTRRKTGYSSFDVIPEFRGVNKIVLFEYPVRFSINDPNRNNYPVLIEIEDEQQLCSNALQRRENGICLYNKTLYLTPYNCRIFFFSERAYKLIIINTKDNKSIKHYNKYRIFPTAEKLEPLKNMPLVRTCSDQSLGESDETKNDKKKGVLYAYLIGQNSSLTAELAHQKYLTQEIYNTIAGINSYIKTGGIIPDTYKKKLEELLEEYKKTDKIERKNYSLLCEKLNKVAEQRNTTLESFIEMLRDLSQHVLNFVYKESSVKWNIPILPLVSELHSSHDYTCLIEQVERHTAQNIASYKNEIPKPSLTTINVEDRDISIEGKELLNIAINYVIDNELTQDKLVANRADVCSKIINQIKDYFITTLGYSENQWREDSHRQYALQLYNSINDYRSSFSLNNAIGLRYGAEFMAIASFLLRGDSIDSYLKYLLKNEIADYSMPLALWGALCGYMEMNRDVLTEFLTDEIYANVYEHLHGTKLYKATFNDAVQEQPKPQSDDYVLCDDYLFVVARTNKIDDELRSELEKLLQDEHVDRKVLEQILNLKGIRAKKGQCKIARNIFDHIASKEYNKLKELGKKNWKEVATHFGLQGVGPDKSKSIKNKQVQEDGNLFSNEAPGSIPS